MGIARPRRFIFLPETLQTTQKDGYGLLAIGKILAHFQVACRKEFEEARWKKG
jgi:hypothetical protein